MTHNFFRNQTTTPQAPPPPPLPAPTSSTAKPARWWWRRPAAKPAPASSTSSSPSSPGASPSSSSRSSSSPRSSSPGASSHSFSVDHFVDHVDIHPEDSEILIQDWILDVASPSVEPFICPYVVVLSSGDRRRGPDQIYKCPRFVCSSVSMFLLAKCEHTSYDSVATDWNDKYTFVALTVGVAANDDDTMSMKTAGENHVITLFLHRGQIDAKWSATVCDPNQEMSNLPRNRKLNVQRYHIAQHILAITNSVPNAPKKGPSNVHLHRCLNVNRCIPGAAESGGICFTGLCASLYASAAWAKLHPHQRASNGNELLFLIRQATGVLRDSDSSGVFVREYHQAAPREEKNQRLQSILRDARRNPGNHHREQSPARSRVFMRNQTLMRKKTTVPFSTRSSHFLLNHPDEMSGSESEFDEV